MREQKHIFLGQAEADPEFFKKTMFWHQILKPQRNLHSVESDLKFEWRELFTTNKNFCIH